MPTLPGDGLTSPEPDPAVLRTCCYCGAKIWPLGSAWGVLWVVGSRRTATCEHGPTRLHSPTPIVSTRAEVRHERAQRRRERDLRVLAHLVHHYPEEAAELVRWLDLMPPRPPP